MNYESTCLCWKTIILKHVFHFHNSDLDNTQYVQKPFLHLSIVVASNTQNRVCHDPTLQVILEVLGFHQPPSGFTTFLTGVFGGGGSYRATNLIE